VSRLAFVLLLSACATTTRSFPVAVRSLVPAMASQRPAGGLAVVVESVTPDNVAEHGDVVQHIKWSVTDMSGPHESGGGGGFAMPASSSTQQFREEEVALVSLPAFRVELRNDTDEPLPLAGLRFELDDGLGGHHAPLPDAETQAQQVMSDLYQRHPELHDANQVQVRDSLRAAALAVQSWSGGQASLAPRTHRVAWVSFRLLAKDADELGRLISGLKGVTLRVSGIGVAPPVAFAFTLAHGQSGLRCQDGTRVSHARDCKRLDMLPVLPVSGGACIQQTRIKYSLFGTQWWMGSSAVANSDLDRTLRASPVAHDDIRLGRALRGAGYGLIGGGILGAAFTTALLAESSIGGDKSYYGLSLLALVPVGAVLVARANAHTDRAIDNFNDASVESGLCVPVW
jgi:hypothetical protein